MLSNRHASTHEDRFVERYSRLLKFARQLTGSVAVGEDLVQDAFVNFTLTRPDLDGIGNLDHYLFTTIRHLLFARTRRGPGRERSLVDFESVAAGLTAVDEAARRAAFVELSAICHYACVRKETSRAGSVLILRFFHGYAPAEIARILGTTSRAVDDWVRLARREARLYRDDPKRLVFMNAGRLPDRLVVKFDPSGDFARALREAVFQSCTGRCEPPGRIEARHQGTTAEPASTETLAHLVSCPACLERVNAALGIRRLSDRSPTDSIGPAPRSNGAGGSSLPAGGNGSSDGAYPPQHNGRPSELRIAVNGFVVSSHCVSGVPAELSLALPFHERLGFIEVLDEADERLLLLSVDAAPDGPAEQSATAIFEKERRLQVRVRFDRHWPTVEVTYDDPAAICRSLEAEPHERAPAEAQSPRSAKSPLRLVRGSFLRDAGVLRAIAAAGDWMTRRLSAARPLRAVAAPLVIALGIVFAPTVVEKDADRLSAATVLRESAVRETQAHARFDTATHRVFDVEQRRLPERAIVSRRRLDVWASPQRDVRARRLYADGDRLIGTRWSALDAAPAHAGDAADAGGNLPADAWLIEPAARTFLSLVPPEDVEVEGGSTDFRLRWRGQVPRRGLVEARLTIAGPELRATEQVLVVDHGDGRLFEYDFTETRFESLSLGQVATWVFDPGIATDDGRDRGQVESTARLAASAATASLRLGAVEVDAWHTLHTLGLLFGSSARVERAGGRVLVYLREPGRFRQQVIADAFEALAREKPIDLDIAAPGADSTEPSLGRATAVGDAVGHGLLVAHFAALAGSAGEQADEIATQHAQWVLDESRRLEATHGSLQYFLARWPIERIAGVDLDHAATWQSLVRDHALSIGIQAERLLSQLQPILAPLVAEPPAAGADHPQPSSPESPLDELPMLSSFVRDAYDSAQALFGASPGSAGSNVLAGRLLRALEHIRGASAAFSRPWRLGSPTDAPDQSR